MAFVQDLLFLSLAIACVCCEQRLTYFESDLTLSDKLCPADEIEFELNSKGVMACLSHCALSGTCEGAIHVEQEGTSTCFGVKSASPFSTSVALPGAMFYKKNVPSVTTPPATTTTTQPPTTTTTPPPTTTTTQPATTRTMPPAPTTTTSPAPTTTTPPATTTTTINVPCLDGWMFFEDSCYYIDASTTNFTSAQMLCTGKGSKLLEIETPDEDAFIESYLQTTQGTEFWIGITDEEEEGVWKMADSLETVTYLNWGEEQPNNGLDSNCAAIWKSFQYQWVDEPCHLLFQPVCEMASSSAG